MAENNLIEILQLQLPDDFFYQEVCYKHQIVLMETGRMKGTTGDYKDFLLHPELPKPTFVIEKSGLIIQLYPDMCWSRCTQLHESKIEENILRRCQITIAIDAWGQLYRPEIELTSGAFNYLGLPHIDDRVHYSIGRGVLSKSLFNNAQNISGQVCYCYDKYTIEQIESLRGLLIYLNKKFDIPIEIGEDIFSYNENAVNCLTGTYTQSSFSIHRYDLHPQGELIEMLKTLKNKSNDFKPSKAVQEN